MHAAQGLFSRFTFTKRSCYQSRNDASQPAQSPKGTPTKCTQTTQTEMTNQSTFFKCSCFFLNRYMYVNVAHIVVCLNIKDTCTHFLKSYRNEYQHRFHS